MKYSIVAVIAILALCSISYAAFEEEAPATTEQTQAQPAPEQPAAAPEQPAQPAPEQPAPAPEQPAAEQPAPAAEQPAAEQPAVEQPAPEQPAPVPEEKPLDVKKLKFTKEIGQFDYNSSDINAPKVNATLKTIAAAIGEKIKAIPDTYQIEVIGHADASGPEEPTGDKKGNIALSEARAQAVVDFLVSELGVSSSKFKVIGMGSKELKSSKSPKSPVNRRVIIKFAP